MTRYPQVKNMASPQALRGRLADSKTQRTENHLAHPHAASFHIYHLTEGEKKLRRCNPDAAKSGAPPR